MVFYLGYGIVHMNAELRICMHNTEHNTNYNENNYEMDGCKCT